MTWALLKNLHLYRDNQREGVWHGEGPVGEINAQTTALIVGTGDIGRKYAAMLKPFGAHILGVRRTRGGSLAEIDELHFIEELPRLIPCADIVFLCLPGGEHTSGLIGKQEFSAMKRGAILINVGRGSVVDTEALVAGLIEGKPAAAGLDVTDPEPLPPGHPLWQMKNVWITPHVAGGLHMARTLDEIEKIALRNLTLLLEGKEPVNIVDRERGYAVAPG